MVLRDPRVNFTALLQLVHSIGAAFGGPHVPSRPFVILYALGTFGEASPTVSDLGQIADLDLKTTSRVLKVFIQRGWVQLGAHERDTRKRRVVLTPPGTALLRLINGAVVDTAFRVVENVMGEHPSNPNLQMRPRDKAPKRRSKK